MKRYRLTSIYSGVLSFLILFFVAVLMVVSIFLVRTKLLQNTEHLGMALAESFAIEEEMNLTSLRRMVTLAGQYVGEIRAETGKEEEIQSWLAGYQAKLAGILGTNVVDLYAVVDGRIIGAVPWEGDADYNYSATEWYQGAVSSRGEVVSSGVYQDAVTGQRVMTLAMALEEPGDVLAMDVYTEKSLLHQNALTLPEEYAYYLCSGDGALLYARTPWDGQGVDLQYNASRLLEGIRDGSLVGYDASFEDFNGVQRGAFSYELESGWVVILTIPLHSILFGEENITVWIAAAAAFLSFVLLAILTIRDAVQNRKMKRADDTIHMLGDSFYAIYRIDIRREQYEALKLSPDTENVLPRSGEFSALMEYIRGIVKPSTYREFQESFSMEEIRRRVEQGVTDYGGDYQRLFGEAYHWVNIRTLYDPSVSKDEVTLCFRDVDEERRQQMQHMILLQDALESARKSTRAKSDFFNNMSHDMRTPLNAILGYCELAQQSRDSDDPEKLREYIRKIDYAGSQLLTLINDILELSRLEAGKSDLQQAEFDLKQLLENNADLFRDQAQAQGKTFTLSLHLKDARVMGDSKKISQILNNLLSNAVKYTNPGGTITLEVRQFDFQQHSKYQIVVEDTGIGMSENFRAHLFEPYSRETTFTARPTMGTGLGMPIVQSLVRQMGGEISVESALGKGSRFTVTLPLEAVQTPAEAEDGQKAETRPAFDWSGKKILLAEDNELNREIASELLSMCGAEVLPAVNGAEAVRVFSEAEPYSIDAILMDMQMPEMDGCEAARTIRALDRPDAAWVPIVAVTANAFAEDIDRTTKAGMDDHVSKPIDFQLLGQVLQKVIRTRDRR